MSVIEPDEWSDYVDELTFGAYYQLTAVEMLIQSIDNGQDQMLYNMHMQMRESADEMLGVIPQ